MCGSNSGPRIHSAAPGSLSPGFFYARGIRDDRQPAAGLIYDRNLSGAPYPLREHDSALAGAASHEEGRAPREMRLCFQAAMSRLNAISSCRV